MVQASLAPLSETQNSSRVKQVPGHQLIEDVLLLSTDQHILHTKALNGNIVLVYIWTVGNTNVIQREVEQSNEEKDISTEAETKLQQLAS